MLSGYTLKVSNMLRYSVSADTAWKKSKTALTANQAFVIHVVTGVHTVAYL